MADVKLGNVKATDAIEHIRQKLNVPTERWDDMLGAAHARAFTVAGATKMDLLNDLHDAVSQAIDDGQSIGDFRKNFADIVQQHGWEYKGSESWRTRVIYDTNMRTAHMAGRWKQIQETKKTRPYLIYKTVGDDHVRPAHAAWNNTVLPVDDPWWDTHYPPNDWGCRCYVQSANDETLKRQDLSVDDSAPPDDSTERINTRTGEIYGEVPKGVGVGWNYNVGKAWLGPDAAFGEKLVQLPPPIRKAALDNDNLHQQAVADDFKVWATDALAADKAVGNTQTVGWLDDAVITALENKNTPPQTAAISVTDHRLRRMIRPSKVSKGIGLPEELLLELPALINDYQAVLLDKQNEALIFVLKQPSGDRTGKLVVNFNFREQGEITNSIRSAGTVPASTLKNKGVYELLAGEL